jgi:hypothetical protein
VERAIMIDCKSPPNRERQSHPPAWPISTVGSPTPAGLRHERLIC